MDSFRSSVLVFVAVGAMLLLNSHTPATAQTTTDTQVLFGDTHVHTTLSVDAYLWSMPMLQGQGNGTAPPLDACDYARFCSALDFFVLTDHAESYTPGNWQSAKEAIRQCNAVSGDPENPDLVAYMGYEWTHVGRTPDLHYGHKNVFFKDDADSELPARPVAAPGPATDIIRTNTGAQFILYSLVDTENSQFYLDFLPFAAAMRNTPPCAEGVPSPDLPEDCFETAATPAALFEKIGQWGIDAIVIPHGTAWGVYTPPTYTYDKQLQGANFNPALEPIIEIYSGHGNVEQYRDFVEIGYDENNQPFCPEPTEDYLPQCWRAGEIIFERCVAAGLNPVFCETRAAEARALFVAEPVTQAWAVVPGTTVEEWLDSGQAQDMFLPAFNYRPGGSAQYSIAITNFDNPTNPLRHTWAFIGSSDNHHARGGAGYKEIDRVDTTESTGAKNETFRRALIGPPEIPRLRARPISEIPARFTSEVERQASYFVTGGLAAVHTEGRSRDAIWDAMKRKEVYATSGDRILLWFDLLNGPSGEAPMGSHLAMSDAPQFEVRAVGALKQLPGCPEDVLGAVSPERLQKLCQTECYNPSDERKLITRFEVVRIRPQVFAGEEIAPLIEDPWLTIPCEPNADGCVAEFSDPEFPTVGRDTVYYVRAIEEPSLAVNGGLFRPIEDANGNVIDIEPCYGDYRTDVEDDCLAEVEERAWSSPIYVDFN